jgi:hypothetical protein
MAAVRSWSIPFWPWEVPLAVFFDLPLDVLPDLEDFDDLGDLEVDLDDLVDVLDFVWVVVATAVPANSNDEVKRAIDLRIRRSKRKRSTSGEIYEFLNNGVIVTAR